MKLVIKVGYGDGCTYSGYDIFTTDDFNSVEECWDDMLKWAHLDEDTAKYWRRKVWVGAILRVGEDDCVEIYTLEDWFSLYLLKKGN